MATKHDFEASALEGALLQIREALGAKGGDFHQKFTTSLDLLEVALQCLIDNDTISRLAVEVGASTDKGKRYVYKYSLGTRKGQGRGGNIQEKTYLKQSVLEEDE